MQEIPAWVVYMVGIANFFQVFSALALIVLGAVGIGILLQIKSIMSEELRKEILPSLSGMVRNAEKTSADVAKNARDVTISINRS